MTFYQVRYNGRTVATFESLRFAQVKKEKLIRDGGCEENSTEVVMIYASGKEEVVG